MRIKTMQHVVPSYSNSAKEAIFLRNCRGSRDSVLSWLSTMLSSPLQPFKSVEQIMCGTMKMRKVLLVRVNLSLLKKTYTNEQEEPSHLV